MKIIIQDEEESKKKVIAFQNKSKITIWPQSFTVMSSLE